MRRIVLASLIAVSLAGCGPAPRDGGGGAANFTPAEIPDWVKLYPGAVVTKTQLFNTNRGVAGTVEYAAPGNLNEIRDFIQRAAREEGFKPGGSGLIFTDPATGRSFDSYTGQQMGDRVMVTVVVRPGWR